jgi:hypothetical protein
MTSTFKYIKDKGIHSAKDYPYRGVTQKCQTVTGKTWKVSGYSEGKVCDFLLESLKSGPVAVAIDATKIYNYKSGIVTECGSVPNSGSLVVGVTDKYWLLKESFGTKFG